MIPVCLGNRGSNISARVTPAGIATTVAGPADLTFGAGRDYTLVTAPDRSSDAVRAILLTDNNTAPASGQGKLRVVNAAPGLGTVDVLLDGHALAAGLDYGKATDAGKEYVAGTYQLKVLPSGSAAPLFGPAPLALKAGGIYTVVLMGRPGEKKPSVQVYTAN